MSALDDCLNLNKQRNWDDWMRLYDEARAELAALRQRIAELEAQAANDYWRKQYDQLAAAVEELHEWEPLEESSILKPRQCCAKCDARAEAVREAAAVLIGDEFTELYADKIRAMPLPPCGDCNPLKPQSDAVDAIRRDLARVLPDLEMELREVGGCDHSVGICVCGLREAVETVAKHAKPSEHESANQHGVEKDLDNCCHSITFGYRKRVFCARCGKELIK